MWVFALSTKTLRGADIRPTLVRGINVSHAAPFWRRPDRSSHPVFAFQHRHYLLRGAYQTHSLHSRRASEYIPSVTLTSVKCPHKLSLLLMRCAFNSFALTMPLTPKNCHIVARPYGSTERRHLVHNRAYKSLIYITSGS